MIDLAIPKGSLEEQTLLLFERADLGIRTSEREYRPKIDDPRIGSVRILRPQEIPKYVEEGIFDLGISGQDWILENQAKVMEVADLGYSKHGIGNVRLVVAVQNESGVKDVRDIKPNSRVTTEYPNITRKFFNGLEIPIRVFYSYGATEAKVPELADVLVDLTETGETLRRNGLRIIGTIMESSTKLIANPSSFPEKRKDIEAVKTLLLGALEAREKVLITMNVPAEKLEDIVRIMPAMKHPTISKLYNSSYYAIESVVRKDKVNILIPKLKELGAEDILELDISKIVK